MLDSPKESKRQIHFYLLLKIYYTIFFKYILIYDTIFLSIKIALDDLFQCLRLKTSFIYDMVHLYYSKTIKTPSTLLLMMFLYQ